MALDAATVAGMVKGYTDFFSTGNKDNYLHKSYKDFTSEDLKEFSKQELFDTIHIIESEHYQYIDQMLPNGMSRADFNRALMRETARRGISHEYYARSFFEDGTGSGNRNVSVQRSAFGSPNPIPSNVTAHADIIAIRDASIDMVINNTPALRLQDDVAAAVGIKNNNGYKSVDTDVAAYHFGYTVGAMPEFKRNDALNIRINSPKTLEEIQQQYCPVMDKMYQVGKEYENRDSMVLGFMQARVDGKNNFSPTAEHVGLSAECPRTPMIAKQGPAVNPKGF